MKWHSKPYSEILEAYGVDSANGLSPERVAEQKEKFGENILLTQKPKSKIVLFLRQFNNPVIIILLVATVLTFAVGDIKDTLVIGIVVLLNTIIGFVQEIRAADALKALRQMAAPSARVLRDGNQISIPTTDVVCGDIMILESGMRTPADGRLIDSLNLIVDESMLTGESFPVEKRHDAIISESVPLGDRVTMVYSGTIIQKGRGVAVVSDVGINTEFGRISQKVAEAEETESPLQINIQKFGKWLSASIVLIIIAIFLVGFLRGNELLTMFLTSVGLAVSAIPEGLPVAVTITLSIGVYQMAKNKAIVKRLAAVETLGSTNIICTDKTGTLTKNQMAVTRIYTGGNLYEVKGSGYSRDGEVVKFGTSDKVTLSDGSSLSKIALISSLCTETTITVNGKEWQVTGDPTEAALMIFADKLGFNRNGWEVTVDIPFESENQIMAVKAKNGNKRMVLVKGAPERVLVRCDSMINSEGEKIPLNTGILDDQITAFSDVGLRVLALAYCEVCADIPLNLDILQNLTFAGFAGIEDAVREEAVVAVGEAQDAGVRVIMITGDHVKTARTIAHAVGIAREKQSPTTISGQVLDGLSDNELYEKVKEIDVYARVSPHHKFRIVKHLQKHQNIVAMTGDGVNDAPALKQADIGVAMGSGTDVAKEAAHMVLMDDNFATIVKAIRRGRIILHNLQHILLYILSTSFGGLLTIAVSVAVGLPLPVLPAQLLWINLVTDGTSTFPLAFEKEHGNVMIFGPRRKNEPLISFVMLRRIIESGIIMMIGTIGAFYFYVSGSLSDFMHIPLNDPDLVKARTIAFCILAFFQIWNVQNSRSVDRSLFFNLPDPKMFDKQVIGKERLDRLMFKQNKILLAVMALAIILQISAVSLPFMNTVFDTVPLGINDWLLVFAISFSIIILTEFFKYVYAIFKTQNIKRELKTV